jgi:hypothetical protein|mmetsp:Transcript_96134/g.161552  ORF Transcript_96134/g.161552 Transcript_96134/m.161552 type:complete len:94 (-) Transcript_96134:532-813(-)
MSIIKDLFLVVLQQCLFHSITRPAPQACTVLLVVFPVTSCAAIMSVSIPSAGLNPIARPAAQACTVLLVSFLHVFMQASTIPSLAYSDFLGQT